MEHPTTMTIEERIRAIKGPIFVFGASGFIGLNLFETLSRYRDDCYAVTHDLRGAWRLKLLCPDAKNILFADILFKNSLRQLFRDYRPRTVFDLSAYGAYSKQDNANLIYETNVIGALNILEESVGVAAFVHAGSSSEYGLNCDNPDEDDQLVPNSHYAVSKISAAYQIKYYGRCRDLPCVNLRFFSIYGPWEEPDRLIPQLICKARRGDWPPLVAPQVSRDFVFVSDAVEAMVNAAVYMNPALYGQSINIGTGTQTTLQQLVECASELFKVERAPTWGTMPNRKWDLDRWRGNYDKAKRLIHWEPRVGLREGLLATSKWQDEWDFAGRILPAFVAPANRRKISCVIACYKDGQAIPVMYERLVKVFAEMKTRYEIIFVNDCSPDDSQRVIEEICAKDPDVVAINHSRNFGSQAAFLSGMMLASGDAVVLMDGDLQDPPELIPDFCTKWQQGFDVVYGRRVRREAPWFMNVCYKAFYRLFSSMSNIPVPVDAGDFSLMDRKVVDELIRLPEKEQFLRGLRAWVGFKQTGVDYVRPERMFGVSTNNWRRNIWWAKKGIFSFSFVPLEVLSYGGLALTVVSFVAMVAQVVLRFFLPGIPHGITTIIVLILFFGGVNLLAASVLGEYLAKVLEETKSRPKFIRRSVTYRGKQMDSATQIETLADALR
jgi:dolichol-phosphate mannosyltransferase